MNFKQVNKLTLVLVLGLIITLSACTKEEDSVTTTVTEEPIELGFRMAINGTEIATDAVAAYCENDSTQFLIIANKQENLVFPLQTQNFEADDFVYFTNTTNGSTWSYGSQALGEDVTGLTGFLSILFSDALIKIESNDGELAVGSSEGELRGIDSLGLPSLVFPYEMSFVAEIIQESDFCE